MRRLFTGSLVLGLALLWATVQTASAAPYTVSYTAGGNWNTVYAQGFNTALLPTPDPGLSTGTPVSLNGFQFYKSGNADSASNIQLAIINNLFADLTGFSTSSGYFVGLSTNTVASTAPIATGDPIPFTFSSLPLTYGNDYAAVFVNVSGTTLTPVRVSALTANYQEVPPGSGSFHPVPNYGTDSQFQYATSNFITTNSFGSFFNTFSFGGDANFTASLDATVPEPASIGVLAGTMILAMAGRRRRRRA
jgi:hypothetical protein